MMYSTPKRLVEVDLPIRRISRFARPEKTTVHGNISTLHIWWARRPHAACRAVLCAALWPDPADEACPDAFRAEAKRLLYEFANNATRDRRLATRCSNDTWTKWQCISQLGIERAWDTHEALRGSLLDFIADFSQWANQTVPEYLHVGKSLTAAAHRSFGGSKNAVPLVFDPFAGGGSIPMEAMRLGTDVFASDLNPLAVLLNKVIVEFIPKFGSALADRITALASEIKTTAEKSLEGLYPPDSDGAIPITYLWARTIKCEGPTCGYVVPLIRTLKLGFSTALKLTPCSDTKSFQISTVDTQVDGAPTIKGGSVTCPNPKCNYTTPAKNVKKQLISRQGGTKDAQLLAVLKEKNGSRSFRPPSLQDDACMRSVQVTDLSSIPDAEINPIRPHKNTRGLSAVTRIGMTRFSDLYNSRQLRAAQVFSSAIQELIDKYAGDELSRAALCIVGLSFGRLLHQNCSASRWLNKRATVAGAFGKQALQVTWDFAESAPLSNAAGSWDSAIEWVLKVIELNQSLPGHGTVVQSSAQSCPLPNGSASVLFTDPPYFAAIPYADLANFFYVWERLFFSKLYPEMFKTKLIDQREEVIVTDANKGMNDEKKDEQYFRREMTRSLTRAREILEPEGIAVVVFADTRTSSWEALLGSVIDSGWTITASWPIDTENQNRPQARGAASLQSSIHLICRPRHVSQTSESHSSSIGDWRDILSDLPKRMHQWMPRLAQEEVVGADAIFACLGPALEVFSRYESVEKANGEQVTLKEYLVHVWAAVAKEALAMVFKGADTTGFEEDARLTAMWLWTISSAEAEEPDSAEEDEEDADVSSDSGKNSVKGHVLEYDAARKLAQGLGVHLESLSSLVEIKGEVARLLPVAERTRRLFGKDDSEAPTSTRKKKTAQLQLGFVAELEQAEEAGSWGNKGAPTQGATVLDRVHQCMILFAAGRGEALRRFLVDEGVGRDERFWRLAQVLSYLYPKTSDEKRWIDGVLARKKGLGF
jgi:putative DNA methylase